MKKTKFYQVMITICTILVSLQAPIVSAQLTPAGTIVTNGGDNVILSYNNKEHNVCNVVSFPVGQVYELSLTNLTGVGLSISPGETVYYSYTVKNTGNGTDTIHLSCEITQGSGGTWTARLVSSNPGTGSIPPSINIPPDTTYSYYIKVTSPITSTPEDYCVIRAIAKNSYYHTHNSSDGWPIGASADIQTDAITTTILPIGIISKIVLSSNITTIQVDAPSTLFTIQTQDKYNNPVNVGTDTLICLNSTSPTGKFATSNIGPWDDTLLVIIPNGSNTVSFYYKDTNNGIFIITATEYPDMGWIEGKRQIVIVVGDISKVTNYPNPFDMTTINSISIGPLPLNTQVKIYTLDLRLVRTLYEQNGEVIWDGRNEGGEKVASGIYIYLVESDKGHKVGKITLIK
ncbi:MAG: T9SS type A sorting domain-containing protein [bacterium]